MAKRVTVNTELTTEELHERSRSASDAVERTHWHILWQIKEGHTPDEVALMLGYPARWIRSIVGRFNQAGEQAMLDHRRTLPGARPLLSQEQRKELDQALDQPPADGGLWSGRHPWQPGWRSVWDGLSTSAVAGSICSAWAQARVCRARSMSKATLPRSRL